MLAGLDGYPADYAHTGVRNTAGPEPLELRVPEQATPEEFARRLDAGEWVVDLRTRTAYAASHLAGAVSLGLDGPLATWLGWMIDWGAPITLLGETRKQVTDAQRELARIGIDKFAAAAVARRRNCRAAPSSSEQLRSTSTASFADLAAAQRGDAAGFPPVDMVPDVRMNSEWQALLLAFAALMVVVAVRMLRGSRRSPAGACRTGEGRIAPRLPARVPPARVRRRRPRGRCWRGGCGHRQSVLVRMIRIRASFGTPAGRLTTSVRKYDQHVGRGFEHTVDTDRHWGR